MTVISRKCIFYLDTSTANEAKQANAVSEGSWRRWWWTHLLTSMTIHWLVDVNHVDSLACWRQRQCTHLFTLSGFGITAPAQPSATGLPCIRPYWSWRQYTLLLTLMTIHSLDDVFSVRTRTDGQWPALNLKSRVWAWVHAKISAPGSSVRTFFLVFKLTK